MLACIAIGVLIYGLAAFGIEPLARYRTGVVDFITACFYGSSSRNIPGPTLIQCPHIGAIWFLVALFIASVEVKVCLRWRKTAPLIIGILAIIAYISRTTVWLPLDIQPALIGAVYVYLGYCARQQGLLELRAPILVNLVLVLVYVLACIYSISVSVAVASLGPYCLGLPVSLCSSFLIMQASHYIADNTEKLKRLLVFFGQGSLVVLCVQIVFLDVGFDRCLTFIGLTGEMNLLQTMNFFIQLGASSLFIVIAKKVPFLRRIFF